MLAHLGSAGEDESSCVADVSRIVDPNAQSSRTEQGREILGTEQSAVQGGNYLAGASNFGIGTMHVTHVTILHRDPSTSAISHGCNRATSSGSGSRCPSDEGLGSAMRDRSLPDWNEKVAELETREREISKREQEHLQRTREQIDIEHRKMTDRESSLQQVELALQAKQHEVEECMAQVMDILCDIMTAGSGKVNPDDNFRKSETGMSTGFPAKVGKVLLEVFGEEDGKGMSNAFRNHTLLQLSAGFTASNQSQHSFRLVPHYNGLSRDALTRLEEETIVVIGGVVDLLRRVRHTSGRPLTYDLVRSQLAQSVFLALRPEESKTFYRALKCTQVAQVAYFFLDLQWILKLVESDVPERTMDIEIERSAEGRQNKEQGAFQPCQHQASIFTFVELAILCFPSLAAPYFKICHLVVKALPRKSTGFIKRNTVYVSIEYSDQIFRSRPNHFRTLAPETKQRAIQRAKELFLV